MQTYNRNVEDLLHPTAVKAFLNRAVRVRVAKDLVERHISLIEDDFDRSGTLLPHNLAKTLKTGCHTCQNPAYRNPSGQFPCKVHELLEGVSELGSMLLIISLFGPNSRDFPLLKAGLNPERSYFHRRLYPENRNQAISSLSFSNLIKVGWQALMHGQCAYLSCQPVAVFQHAAKIMGHGKVSDSTIISSLNGQVLFPSFFEATEFLREGYLQMSAFPGKLEKGDMQFDFLLDAWSEKCNIGDVNETETEVTHHIEVSGSMNDSTGAIDAHIGRVVLEDPHRDQKEQNNLAGGLQADSHSATASKKETNAVRRPSQLVAASFAEAKRSRIVPTKLMIWNISVRDEMLHGEMRLRNDGRMIAAWALINELTSVRLSPDCPHPYNNPVGELAGTFRLAPNDGLRVIDASHSLIVAGQSYVGQLSALYEQYNELPVIVHVDGCIQCAMRLGLAEKVSLLIS